MSLEDYKIKLINAEGIYKWIYNNILIGDIPSLRSGHTATLIDDDIYIIGGFNTTRLNDIYAYNISTSIWRKITTTPPLPPLAFHCTIAISCNCLLIVGGTGKKHEMSVLLYEIGENRLTTINCKGKSIPLCRNGHSSVMIKDKIYIIGGTDYSLNNNSLSICKDIYSLSLPDYEWEKYEINTTNYAVYNQTCNLICNNIILQFGGHSGHRKNSNISLFDVNTHKWIDNNNSLLLLSPHSTTTPTTISSSFNNFFENSIDNNYLIQVNGELPQPREKHSAVYISNKNMIIFIGGLNDLKKLNDIAILQFNNNNNIISPNNYISINFSKIENEILQKLLSIPKIEILDNDKIKNEIEKIIEEYKSSLNHSIYLQQDRYNQIETLYYLIQNQEYLYIMIYYIK